MRVRHLACFHPLCSPVCLCRDDSALGICVCFPRGWIPGFLVCAVFCVVSQARFDLVPLSRLTSVSTHLIIVAVVLKPFEIFQASQSHDCMLDQYSELPWEGTHALKTLKLSERIRHQPGGEPDFRRPLPSLCTWHHRPYGCIQPSLCVASKAAGTDSVLSVRPTPKRSL